MSKNRRRNGGMKRAYLKKTQHRYDSNPDSTLKAAIGLNRDINPITATPHRARLWLDKHKHTPLMTEPMKERVESWRIAVNKQDEWYMQVCVDTPLRRIEMFFRGFTDRAVYYFKEIDRISGVERESFTISKALALRIRDNQLKGIPWRT